MLQVGLLGQTLCGVEQFTTADAGAPDAHIVAVLQLGEVGSEAVSVEVVHLFLASQLLVAREGDDFHAGSHDQERHVEANLVVAGACAAVSDGFCTNLLGIACDGDSLEDAFRTDADRVTVVTQDISEDHVLQRLLVVLLRHIERHILRCPQLIRILLVGLQLFSAEAACVGASGVHFIS